MARFKVSAPVADYTGEAAGVEFRDGVAEVDAGPALAYFRQAGYGVEEIDAVPESTPKPAPARRGRKEQP